MMMVLLVRLLLVLSGWCVGAHAKCGPSSQTVRNLQSECNDNNACTNDVVVEGTCTFTDINCFDLNPNTATDGFTVCEPTTGCQFEVCKSKNVCEDNVYVDYAVGPDGKCQAISSNCVSSNPNPTTDGFTVCDASVGCQYEVCKSKNVCEDNVYVDNAVGPDGKCQAISTNCVSSNPNPTTDGFTVCDASVGCQYEVCKSKNVCVDNGHVYYVVGPDGKCQAMSMSCDDGNPLTIDTCDPVLGCLHECNDGNACTLEEFVDGVCVHVNADGTVDECTGDDCTPGIRECDDNDYSTIDVCVPSTGCRHLRFSDYIFNLDELDRILDELEQETALFYEDEVSLTEPETLEIISWIRLEVTQLRTPFCWRRSYGRGVGAIPTDCPSSKEKIGALCYTPCESGYSRQGTFDCQQDCKAGWRDDGLFCRKTEYGRGGGYPWEFGDALNDSGMFSRCERDYGRGNCQKNGLIVYPKCAPGYSEFGCCICRPNFSSCEAEGYTSVRIDLSCGVKVREGDPTVLQCASGLEEDAGLCYAHCATGYDGVGPVCWQQCDVDQVNCGAGCAATELDCGLAVLDQVLAPLIVAANIFTLGATSGATAAADAAADAVVVGSKAYRAAKAVGKAMVWLAKKLQSISPDGLQKGATLATRIKKSRTGTLFKKVKLGAKVSGKLYGAGQLMSRQFATDFVDQTSLAIAQKLVNNLDPVDVIYMQRLWADVQYKELAEAEGWNIAGFVLSVVGLVDITGITDLVNAYLKPVCAEIFPFPFCKKSSCSGGDGGVTVFIPNDPPEAKCKSVQAYATFETSCAAEVQAISVDDGSYDPNRDKIFLSLQQSGPFSIGASPHAVTLSVKDSLGAADTCTATIEVSDITPSTIACPEGVSVDNDPAICSAVVTYPAPVVQNNCESTSTTAQIAGLQSGGVFPRGSTTNTFQSTDSLGNMQECSFTVAVFDSEAPLISCDGLTAVVPTDPGVCISTYLYDPPVATDNCQASTVITQTPDIDPSKFPLGASTVQYTATDVEGNAASCSFEVVVEDRELPKISCPNPIRQGTDDGVCSAVVRFQVPVGADNCPDQFTEQTSALGNSSTFPIDQSTVSYKVTDGSTNTASCSFTVDIFDDEIPVGFCPLGPNPGGIIPSANAGFRKISGSDNCQVQKPGLKAYVFDSGSGTRFPTASSGLKFYPVGTTFKYVKAGGPIQEKVGSGQVQWMLKGTGNAYVIIEDEAGNLSMPAYC